MRDCLASGRAARRDLRPLKLIVTRRISGRNLGYGSEKAMRRRLTKMTRWAFIIVLLALLVLPWKTSLALLPILGFPIAMWIYARRGRVTSKPPRLLPISAVCTLTLSLLLGAYLNPISQLKVDLFLRSGITETGTLVTNVSETWYIGDIKGHIKAVPTSTVRSAELTYDESSHLGPSPAKLLLGAL